MTKVLGILMLATVSACSGGDEAGPKKSADAGGLDGGGSISVGLLWDKGVFVQAIWVDGQPSLLVSNRRAEEVSFGVFTTEYVLEPQGRFHTYVRRAPLVEAMVPAHSTRTLDAAALLGEPTDLLWVGVGDELLGLQFRPQPPSITGTLSVISNEFNSPAQVETDFSVLSGSNFEATVTLTQPGQLWVEPSPSPSADVEFLTATAGTSDGSVTTTTPEGFRIELPADTSETNPAHVQLSFARPLASAPGDPLLALHAGWFCSKDPGGSSECGSGRRVLRLVPEP